MLQLIGCYSFVLITSSLYKVCIILLRYTDSEFVSFFYARGRMTLGTFENFLRHFLSLHLSHSVCACVSVYIYIYIYTNNGKLTCENYVFWDQTTKKLDDKQIQANKESKLPSIPATDQFINWWDASNSCFSALWTVDKYTMTEDKPTKRAW